MTEITRQIAVEIASQFLKENAKGFTVKDIYTWDEIPYRKPCLYNLKPEEAKGWIIYLKGPNTGFMIKSSDILIISRDFGEVLYFGRANDEV
jgi:hypothetical protein